MPTIHLICGSTGAGKTTYALKLSEEQQMVRFSIDEWMNSLFWPDSPEKADLEWALERIERCESQIWNLCQQLMSFGHDVVLDLGLSKKQHRDKFMSLANEIGVSAQLHYVDADVEVRRARVLKRNADKSQTYEFDVTEQMFEFMEGWFEAPIGEELDNAILIKTDSSNRQSAL